MTRKPKPAPWTHITSFVRLTNEETFGEYYAELDIKVDAERTGLEVKVAIGPNGEFTEYLFAHDPAAVQSIAAFFENIMVSSERYRESRQALEVAAD